MFNNIAIAFVCGTLAALLRDTSLSALVIVVVAILGISCVCARFFVLGLVGWFLIGFAWCVFYSQQAVSQWLPAEQEGQALVVSGYITDFPRPSDDGWQFDFFAEELQGKLRLSTRNLQYENFPSFFCRYRLRVKLKQPRGLLNFGQYDYQSWLLQAGYQATGYVQSVEGCAPYVPNLFLQLRKNVNTAIAEAQISAYASSTLSALLIGNYADIDSVQWKVLRDSGTIHLLSVSGLHIVLVAVLFHFLFKKIVCISVFPLRYWPADHWAAIASLCFAVFYALMTGFSVATQRSLIMVTVAVLQRLAYGKFQLSFIFLLSLMLVVVINPLSVLSASFWFTYVATAVLMLAGCNTIQSNAAFLHRYVVEPFRLQMIMFVMMVPVLLSVYGRVSLLSLPLNIMAVPWVSFISLPCGFAALLLMPFSEKLSNLMLQFSGWTLDIYWQVMQWVLHYFEGWQLMMGGVSTLALLLSMIGLGLLCFFPRHTLRRVLAMVLCVPLLFPYGMALPEKTVEVQVLDVGQGLAVIVRTARHVMTYDTGDKHSERFDAGRDIVATALRNFRIEAMNMLVISHADSDHAGGRNGLLAEIFAKQKWSGTPEQLSDNNEYLPCSAGMHWRWDGVDFKVLYPIENTEGKNTDNNRSCVIQIDAGGRRLLLTGDIEKQGEQQVLASGVDLRADVLMAPHHGSKTSSSPAFLNAVAADTVVLSSGYKNRFHHPAHVVSQRYKAHGMTILNTAEVGAVRIRLSDSGIHIKKALCMQSSFWREARYNAHCSY